MDHGVRAAVSEAYRVFAPYSFGAGGPGNRDSQVLGPLEERLLRVTPVNEIPAELLAAHAASLTGRVEGTDADDFRALLPRYFELIAAEDSVQGGWKRDVLRGLVRAEFAMRWPPAEVEAIDRFLAALLAAAEARGDAEEIAAMRALMAELDMDSAVPRRTVRRRRGR